MLTTVFTSDTSTQFNRESSKGNYRFNGRLFLISLKAFPSISNIVRLLMDKFTDQMSYILKRGFVFPLKLTTLLYIYLANTERKLIKLNDINK